MLWNYGLKNLKLTILWFFTWFPQVPLLLYSSKNIKNSYILYTFVLKFTWIHIMFILMFWNVENLNLSVSLRKYFFDYLINKRLFYTICRRSLQSRTVSKNLRNQSQCFMAIFRNLKNQSAFYNHHALRISMKIVETFFLGIVHYT